MRKSLYIVVLLFIASLLFACAGKKPVEQIHTFPSATWHRFDILTFEMPVKQSADEYTMQAIVRYTEALEHDRIPIHFIMTFPSGEKRIWEQNIVIRDRDGKNLGEKMEGVYEIVIPVRTRLVIREAGNLVITAEQFIPKFDTYGVVSFGLRIITN
jgi:gliding motility-associated lipoprotein GldH